MYAEVILPYIKLLAVLKAVEIVFYIQYLPFNSNFIKIIYKKIKFEKMQFYKQYIMKIKKLKCRHCRCKSVVNILSIVQFVVNYQPILNRHNIATMSIESHIA